MYFQTSGVLKLLTVAVAVGLLGGCAPAVYMSAKNVPNPVYLCGPSHIVTNNSVVNVTVKNTAEQVTVNAGTSLEAKIGASTLADSNKTSEAIIKATQGNSALDVQFKSVSVGGYFLGIPGWTIEKTWIKAKGGISENGKENVQ